MRMKKIILFILTMCCGMSIHAADYPYLVFEASDGTIRSLNVENMTLTVSGSTLQVTCSDGSVTFPLSDLVAMQFSTNGEMPAGMDEAEASSKHATKELREGVLFIHRGNKTYNVQGQEVRL